MSAPQSIPLKKKPSAYTFSVCSIVTNMVEYGEMKDSFENCGFTSNAEYLLADNTNRNQFDAYTAIKRFTQEAKGEYLILVHQDVRCIDTAAQLSALLEELSKKDSNWAICGNAGAMGYHQDVRYIVNGGKIVKHENLPARVFSLDENFLVIRTASGISASSDLHGFHLYATDLCIIADFLGYTCYTIPFLVKHLSLGNLKELEEHKKDFLQQYGRKLRHRFLQTPSTKFYLSHSVSKNKWWNGRLLFLVKWTQGFKLLFKKPGHKALYKKTSVSE